MPHRHGDPVQGGAYLEGEADVAGVCAEALDIRIGSPPQDGAADHTGLQ